MSELTFNNPESGEPRGSSDGKIRTALTKIKETVNGGLDHTNLSASAGITDAQLASSNNSAYRVLLAANSALAESFIANTYMLTPKETAQANEATFIGSTAFPSLPTLYFAKADYEVAGKTQKLRLRSQVWANGTKPTIKFTFGLYPVTVSGGEGAISVKLGSVVSGSTVEINEPAASTITSGVNSDFTIPSDGAYVLGVVTNGTLTSKSKVLLSAQLQTRSV